jgi:glutathione S-transferase
MMMTLYHAHDARSLRCLWALEELGVDYELVNLEFPPRYRHKEFLEINPLGTVPALVVDGLVLTESAAITQYLAERYSVDNLAVDPSHKDYPGYLNWLHRSDATLTFPLAIVLRYGFLADAKTAQPQVVKDYIQFFLGRLNSVDAALQSRDYLVADRFTAADICVGYAIFFAKKVKLGQHFSDAVNGYLQRLMARPAFKAAVEKQAELLERQPELKLLFAD